MDFRNLGPPASPAAPAALALLTSPASSLSSPALDASALITSPSHREQTKAGAAAARTRRRWGRCSRQARCGTSFSCFGSLRLCSIRIVGAVVPSSVRSPCAGHLEWSGGPWSTDPWWPIHPVWFHPWEMQCSGVWNLSFVSYDHWWADCDSWMAYKNGLTRIRPTPLMDERNTNKNHTKNFQFTVDLPLNFNVLLFPPITKTLLLWQLNFIFFNLGRPPHPQPHSEEWGSINVKTKGPSFQHLPNDAPHISLTPFCFRKEVEDQNTPQRKVKCIPIHPSTLPKDKEKRLLSRVHLQKVREDRYNNLSFPGTFLLPPIRPIILVFSEYKPAQ
jgi:hypothetical protein